MQYLFIFWHLIIDLVWTALGYFDGGFSIISFVMTFLLILAAVGQKKKEGKCSGYLIIAIVFTIGMWIHGVHPEIFSNFYQDVMKYADEMHHSTLRWAVIGITGFFFLANICNDSANQT